MLVINPKRNNGDAGDRSHWYSYYAGYSHSFAKKVIEEVGLLKSSIILDPWNGAGTTTLMASMAGYQSIGIDLNPVMKIIAKAKQATKEIISDIDLRLAGLSTIRLRKLRDDDPLRYWFLDSGVRAIRKVERLIIRGHIHTSISEKVNSLSAGDCLLYVALFNCVRMHLKNFIPSNPTWIKKPKSELDKIGLDWVVFKKQYLAAVADMMKVMNLDGHDWDVDGASLMVASSTSLPLPNSYVDLVLTSPPYCTRIDYGIATLPELALISASNSTEVDDIRRILMGTTTVPKGNAGLHGVALGAKCSDFLDSVKAHSSKASATYYYKNLFQYFSELSKSIHEISRVMKDGASFVCVVQDSFYKDVHCDLPGIIVELGGEAGLMLNERYAFESKQNMVNLNGRSKSYREKSTAYECVLVLSK